MQNISTHIEMWKVETRIWINWIVESHDIYGSLGLLKKSILLFCPTTYVMYYCADYKYVYGLTNPSG